MRLGQRAGSAIAAMLVGLAGPSFGGLAWADAPKAAAAADQRDAAAAPTYAVPLTMRSKTGACDVKATLPPEAAATPAVLKAVSADAVAWLWELTSSAAEAEKESGKQEWWRPYSGELAFKPAFVSDRVVSLLGEWWQDTGGAHPNSGFLTENVDPKSGASIEWADLFPAEAGAAVMSPALRKYVHDDLMRQKRQRLGDGFDAKMAEDFMKDLGHDAPSFTFAGSEEPGAGSKGPGAASRTPRPVRASGLVLHFGPYDVGAYAEGPYTVRLPAAVIADALAPAWRDAFAR